MVTERTCKGLQVVKDVLALNGIACHLKAGRADNGPYTSQLLNSLEFLSWEKSCAGCGRCVGPEWHCSPSEGWARRQWGPAPGQHQALLQNG